MEIVLEFLLPFKCFTWTKKQNLILHLLSFQRIYSTTNLQERHLQQGRTGPDEIKIQHWRISDVVHGHGDHYNDSSEHGVFGPCTDTNIRWKACGSGAIKWNSVDEGHAK